MLSGIVSLIGAGPGRADFLTLAAVRSLETADVVLYDALIGADIQAYFPKKAKLVYVGKRCGQHSLTQAEINERLVFFAKQGFHVARLKGGDPFIFGRGAEEVAVLKQHDIPFRIIPGISALNGIAAAVGLPLTARTQSNEFRAIQGHYLPEDPEYWHSLAQYHGTLVVFMGLGHLDQLLTRLLEHGALPAKPIAIIETDIDGQQIISKASLVHFANEGFQKKTTGPGIIYIGDNVELMVSPYQSQSMEKKHERSATHIS